MSGFGYLLKDYHEGWMGRIEWESIIAMLPELAGRRKRIRENWGEKQEWKTLSDADGRPYSYFKGRGAKCYNLELWRKGAPVIAPKRGRQYCEVPARCCKECEFHKPAKKSGRQRYAICKWEADWQKANQPSALGVFVGAVAEAQEILK